MSLVQQQICRGREDEPGLTAGSSIGQAEAPGARAFNRGVADARALCCDGRELPQGGIPTCPRHRSPVMWRSRFARSCRRTLVVVSSLSAGGASASRKAISRGCVPAASQIIEGAGSSIRNSIEAHIERMRPAPDLGHSSILFVISSKTGMFFSGRYEQNLTGSTDSGGFTPLRSISPRANISTETATGMAVW